MSPLWKDLDQKSRAIRILVLGAVIYVVLYSVLYSKIANIFSTITSYRKYMYIIAASDIALTFSNFYKNYKPVDKKKKKKKRLPYYEHLARFQIPQQQNIQNQLVHQSVEQPINSYQEKPIKEEIFVKSFKDSKKKLPLIKLDELRQINMNKKPELLDEDEDDDDQSISSIPVYNNNQESIPIYKSKIEENDVNNENESIPVYNQKI
jgi:hypothetical protein